MRRGVSVLLFPVSAVVSVMWMLYRACYVTGERRKKRRAEIACLMDGEVQTFVKWLQLNTERPVENS